MDIPVDQLSWGVAMAGGFPFSLSIRTNVMSALMKCYIMEVSALRELIAYDPHCIGETKARLKRSKL